MFGLLVIQIMNNKNVYVSALYSFEDYYRVCYVLNLSTASFTYYDKRNKMQSKQFNLKMLEEIRDSLE